MCRSCIAITRRVELELTRHFDVSRKYNGVRGGSRHFYTFRIYTTCVYRREHKTAQHTYIIILVLFVHKKILNFYFLLLARALGS